MRLLELKIPPVVTTLLVGGLMGLSARATPDLAFALPSRRLIAAVPALVGVVIATLAVTSFRRVKTTIHPLHPEDASALVTSGIFSLTRNPMYLGLLLVLLGWAVYLTNALAFIFPVVYVPLMNHLQILPEERALAAKFGPEFSVYRSKVRRWL